MKKFIRNLFIFICVFILSAAIVTAIDYFTVGNQHLGNYQAAILDKSARLRTLDSPKLVLLGNSNLAFGIDSKMLEDELGMPVVNMGLHGGLGSAFNENMIKLGDVREGDIVILAHHTYSDNDDIEDPALALITLEKHTDLWRLIRYKDIPGILRAYPDYFKDCIVSKLTGERDNIPDDNTCYSRSAFNEYGDVYKRFDDKYEFYPGSITVPDVNETCTDRINDLNAYISSKGATLLIAGYPIGYGEFTPDASEYDSFEEKLRDSVDCEVISHFTDYFIPYDMFYDTKYHLDEDGVKLRTRQLILDIEHSGARH